MVDPLPSLESWKNSFRGLDKVRKNHIRLLSIILMASMGLFFYFDFETLAYMQKDNMKTILGPETIDPLSKIGKGITVKTDPAEVSCENKAVVKKTETDPRLEVMLAGSPMEVMAEALSGRKDDVAAYLVAIAKKESNWGRHTPKKNGKECYNYWGYRGKENPTDSGYSCFDSPDHAVDVVGNRIERLIDQDIDTPARMVVWKCGSNCEAAGGQAAANKWISDVTLYYNKLKG